MRCRRVVLHTEELFCLWELAFLTKAGLVHESRAAMLSAGIRASCGTLSSYLQFLK